MTHLTPRNALSLHTPIEPRNPPFPRLEQTCRCGIYKGQHLDAFTPSLNNTLYLFLLCILVSLVSLLVPLLLKLARNWPWSLPLVLLLTAMQPNARMMYCTLLQESKRLSSHPLLAYFHHYQAKPSASSIIHIITTTTRPCILCFLPYGIQCSHCLNSYIPIYLSFCITS